MLGTSLDDDPQASRAVIDLSFRERCAIVVAVLRRPSLWPTVLRLLIESSPPGWWKRPPFVPTPDAEYVRFRVLTAYGSAGRPTAADVVGYLEWCAAARTR